ncbi:MAG TPA: DinB family protein [Thermoanaerobaculia bacterium]|nr:DinB family protein [Thermoanaerobaculia bacterium]
MEIPEIGPFLRYWDKVRGRTLRVARCIPPEHLEWEYREGRWTFGDLLRHLGAIERYMFAETVQGGASRYPGCGRELAEGYDEVFAFLERTHTEAREIFARLTPQDLQGRCETPGGTALPVWKWLRSMVEHECHHRGQLYLYLAHLGIGTPPLYGLTSEEVLERSVRAAGSS